MAEVNFIPYFIAAVSVFVSVLLAIIAWFAKRELANNKKELDTLRKTVEIWMNLCSKCPSELKLWVQSNFLTLKSFERHETQIQENVNNFKKTLENVDNNISYLASIKDDK